MLKYAVVFVLLCFPSIGLSTCCQDMLCPLCQQETQLIREVNLLRSKHGLGPLVRDVQLINGSRWHSFRQARSGRLYHQLDGYCSGECIAVGQHNVSAVVRSWYYSPGHRAIMLSRNAHGLGASRSGSYWTLRIK